MNKNAVCITVYKNRYCGMLQRIETIDKEFDVFIVAQENDPNLNDYYCYGAEVLVPNVTSIFQKREYVRNEMIRRGYEGFFMFDDDIKYFVKITEETKRTTSDSYAAIKCNDFNEVLHKLIETADNNNCAFASLNYAVYIGFQKPNSVMLNKRLSAAGAACYFKTDALIKHDIHYDVTGEVNEDIDIVVKLLQHGCNCVTCNDYAFRTFDGVYGSGKHLNSTTLFKNMEDIERLYMNNTLKYHFDLKLNKYNVISNIKKYEKYFNTFELPKIDENILNFCQNKDILGLKQYLKQLKDEKNKNRKKL